MAEVLGFVMATVVLCAWAFDCAFDGRLMRKKGRLCWWHFRLGSPLFVGTVSGWLLPSLLYNPTTTHSPMERVYGGDVYPVLAAIAGAFIGLLVDVAIVTTRMTDRGRFQFSLQEMLMWFACLAMLLGALTTCIRELMIPMISY